MTFYNPTPDTMILDNISLSLIYLTKVTKEKEGKNIHQKQNFMSTTNQIKMTMNEVRHDGI